MVQTQRFASISTRPRLTYTIAGSTYLADPTTGGLDKVSFATKRETDQLFYRTKWTGELQFYGADYTRLYDLSRLTCCQLIQVSFYRISTRCVANATNPYWRGVFDLSDLSFDIDRSVATLKNAPRPDDGYQTMMERWKLAVNWMDIPRLQPIYDAARSALYTRARPLIHLLAGLVSLTLTGTKALSLTPLIGAQVASQFLESPVNPVTGRANQFYGAVCLQAADFYVARRPDQPISDSFTTKASITLKEVLDDMQAMARLFIYIDPGTGTLHWEHESFFPQLSYAPATAQTGFSIPPNDPAWKDKRTVSFDKEQVYGTYKLAIDRNVQLIPTEQTIPKSYGLADVLSDEQKQEIVNQRALERLSPLIGLNFGSSTIEFLDPCIYRTPDQDKLIKTLTVTRFITNLTHARLNKSAVDLKDGIFLLAAKAPGPGNLLDNTPSVPTAALDIMNAAVENADLSATTLLRDFHRHNQPFATGFIDPLPVYNPGGQQISMLSITPLRKLAAVTVGYCCDDPAISLTGLFTSWYADDGLLLQADYTPATDQLKLELAHTGPCQLPPALPLPAVPVTCPLKGTLLRTDSVNVYPAGSTVPNGVKYTYHFADGQCGEYTVDSFLTIDLPH